MTFPRKIGLLLILVAGLATWGHFAGLELPSLRWFYSFTGDANDADSNIFGHAREDFIGVVLCSMLALIGVLLIARGGRFHWNPLTLRKMERFRSIGRGYTSFWILLVMLILALLDQLLVGNQALAVKFEGKWYFPAFVDTLYKDKDFGGQSDENADYRKLAERWKDSEDRVILPPVPWNPTLDTDDLLERGLTLVQGRVIGTDGQPYNGFAYAYAKGEGDRLVRAGKIRDGRLSGSFTVYDENSERAGREDWEDGKLMASRVSDDVTAPMEHRWVQRIYAPLPPTFERRHFLGTDSKGWDVLAQLYGGMQVLFKAATLYLLATYGFGITMGCLMGFFGGAYDLVMQRVMEVVSNVPFLLVVMIISQNIGRDNVTLGAIVGIFCIFSWISPATLLRTATFKEKARDYVSSARVLGASTGRVIFRHILPNAISTIVTLVPFSVAGVITALTALDFLGFGVPDAVPSIGRVLDEGRANLDSAWIVSSVFGVMVVLLLLITFVGEAVREAFDPKKYTTYQ